MITNPISQYCILIIFLVPGIWLAGLNLARKATHETGLHYWLAPGIGLALWLLTIQVIGQLSASFTIGLWVASLMVALPGLYSGKKALLAQMTNPNFSSRTMWLSAIATTLCVSSIALNWHFHDEYYVSGHLSIVAQMQNDAFPPVHMTFPDQSLKYHYGFDLFCTLITALLRTPVDLSIDIATTLLWGYTWCLLWVLGEKFIGKKQGFLLPLVVLFGGGFPFFGTLASQGNPLLVRFLGLSQVDGHLLNPPFISYFFQHPWALGTPLTACILLLTLGKNISTSNWRYCILGLLFIALSFSHVVLFLTVFGSFLLSESLKIRNAQNAHIFSVFLLFCTVALGAFLVGGFFQYNPDSMQNFFSFRFSPFNSTATFVEWYALNFGLLLPFGIAGIFYLKSDRIFFLTLLAGSLAVFNFIEYDLTYDIVKFATIISMALAFLSCITLSQLLIRTGCSRIVGTVSLILITSIGWSFTAVAALKLKGSPLEIHDKGLVKLSPQDISAVNWLRQHVKQRDIVFRMRPMSTGYAQSGGLAQSWVAISGLYFGFSREKLFRRLKLQSNFPSDPDEYLSQGIRWLVLAPWEKPFDNYIQQWLKNKRAILRIEFSPLKIYEILPAPPGNI